MGGSSSKPPAVQAPAFDYDKAKVSLSDVDQYVDQVKDSAAVASEQLTGAFSQVGRWQWIAKLLGGLLLIGGLAYLGFYYVWPAIRGLIPTKTTGLVSADQKDLSITSAMAGSKDVKKQVIDRVSLNELHVQVDDSLGVSEGESLVVAYQYPGNAPGSITVPYGKTMDIVRAGKSADSSSVVPGSDVLTAPKDAKEMSVVTVGDNAPEGDYGYQFWMYVADWNYKFGQEKNVMFRSDPTNSAIKNPVVSLHPTDNTMKIMVSIFPSGDASKAEPAPAGHSGATDDVFVCEIPNIPLQTWLAVGITLSTRNMDVYLNGQLVKSCFLTGVPKPVTGSITLNDGGGFSGWMCSFKHDSKLLVPSDAQSFFGAGVPCNVPGTTTNYKVTFGVKDTKGALVSKYMF